MDFESWEHIIVPIILALLSGAGVAAYITARTGAKAQYVDGLRNTITSMQDEMKFMQERMAAVQKDLATASVTISDLRAQISTLQSSNFEWTSKVTDLRRENADLHMQIRDLRKMP